MSKLNQEILSSVKNGNLTRNRQAIKDAIASFEGLDVIIKIEKPKRKRSNQQNKFYWSCIVPIVRNCLKDAGYLMNTNDTHELLKLKFLKDVLFVDEDTEEVIERIKSTTELTTVEEKEYFENIKQWVMEYFNTEIPEPNEDLTLSL